MKLSLAEWRRARNISQEKMADLCSVHVNTYREWEQNEGRIKVDKAILICDALNISLDDLLLPSDTSKSGI